MTIELPSYLARPHTSGETFGTLKKVKNDNATHWIIEGDPQVAVMAKRLFPGSEGRGAGLAKFPANRRTFADLVWFLHRWPLQILTPEEFETDYQETCLYVNMRQALNANPARTEPDVVFKGELRPFQQEGLSWMLTNRRTLLADGYAHQISQRRGLRPFCRVKAQIEKAPPLWSGVPDGVVDGTGSVLSLPRFESGFCD